jgi:hypothetical protein
LLREDPAHMSTGQFGRNFFYNVSGTLPTMFTSVIIVNSCYLDEPKVPGFGKPVKVIDGALIEGEWERFGGATGMILGVDAFQGQLFKDYLSFSTMASTSHHMSASKYWISTVYTAF